MHFKLLETRDGKDAFAPLKSWVYTVISGKNINITGMPPDLGKSPYCSLIIIILMKIINILLNILIHGTNPVRGFRKNAFIFTRAKNAGGLPHIKLGYLKLSIGGGPVRSSYIRRVPMELKPVQYASYALAGPAKTPRPAML